MAQRPRTIRKLDAKELLDYALKLLGGRALSTSEVRGKLSRKAAEPEDVPGVLSKLKEYGYLDDSRFADSYAAARRDSGNFGKARVARDLRQRRVAPTLADKAAQTAYADVNEEGMVLEWLSRKYRTVDLREYLQDEKHLASAYRKLRYAGFGSSVSVRVLKRYADRADELEDSEPEN